MKLETLSKWFIRHYYSYHISHGVDVIQVNAECVYCCYDITAIVNAGSHILCTYNQHHRRNGEKVNWNVTNQIEMRFTELRSSNLTRMARKPNTIFTNSNIMHVHLHCGTMWTCMLAARHESCTPISHGLLPAVTVYRCLMWQAPIRSPTGSVW